MAEPPTKKAKLQETDDNSSVDLLSTPVDKILNSDYLSSELVQTIKEDFLSHKPFSYTVLPSFLDEKFLEECAKELESEEWFPKNNDLYTFLQTDDLKVTKKPHLAKMKEVIYSPEFRSFLQGITGLEVNDKVDISASKYWNGCQLLCHDDEYEGRRIAFIFYLVPKDWSEEDGGTLDLFNVDENGQPSVVTESILPAWNNFLFFEVTPTSFHQVAEVLSSKQRLSISGWFHGVPVVRPPPYIEEPLPKSLISSNASVDLSKWIHPNYLKPEIQAQINQQFAAQSSIELNSFMLQDKFDALAKVFADSLRAECFRDHTSNEEASLDHKPHHVNPDEEADVVSKEALEAENDPEKTAKVDGVQVSEKDLLPFSLIGPANRRHYESLGRWKLHAGIHPLVKEAIDVFQSPEFAKLLEAFTGLDLMQVHSEVRRFRQGSYTLAQDNQDQHSERGLDAYFFSCPVDTWDVDVGGQITYMDEEDELVTLIPSDNSIALVYRDVGCMKYVKYVNNEAPSAREEFTMTFWENPESITDEQPAD